jgi:hypothetical protein
VSSPRTLAVAIVATAALGETLRFAIRAPLGFLRRVDDTGDPSLVTLKNFQSAVGLCQLSGR